MDTSQCGQQNRILHKRLGFHIEAIHLYIEIVTKISIYGRRSI
jgi:hypothetical protein